ncbi:NAD(P)-binding protein [Polyplosphaeria fusca]|uniref:NAD(P)-binding protein n=1 Tax=Polyplosphaeria fusca TaxID=682080 RepID=A0A9P4UWY7_9PLEO|nr:NAD(P)-binding protein [Polyplosphaeria fusca]
MTDFSALEFTRYVDVHRNTKGPGDARPTAMQIVKDNALEGKLSGKVVIITGCSAGIGVETARAMKATGAHVFVTARDLGKAQKVLADILEPGKLDLMLLKLDSLQSVRSFTAEFLQKSGGRLNILINNAGVMRTPEGRTSDGFETQFGTNHLSHFLLFQLLRPALIASATPDFNSRVVNVSSTGHRGCEIHFDNPNLDGEYDGGVAYGQSKLANIYMANYIDRHYGSQGLHALSIHPGGIWEGSGLQQHIPQLVEAWKKMPGVAEHMKSQKQGAATTVWAAVGNCWEGKGGRYLEDCQVSAPCKEGYTILDMGYETNAYNVGNEERLWKMSNELVGFQEE